MAALALTACSKAAPPSIAQEFDKTTACALDGMLLADYPGPKAQIRYAGQDTPDFFCDTVEMFSIYLKPEAVRQVAALYVQDMGATDWDNPKGAWIDAKTALYVVGSNRNGSMGPTIASFAKEDAAKKFIGQFGGRLYKFSEITPEMVDLGGGALHDAPM